MIRPCNVLFRVVRSVVERTSSNQGNDAILRYQGILKRKD